MSEQNTSGMTDDKEKVWKRLKHVPRPTADDDLFNFFQSIGRGVKGVKKGELNIIACGKQISK